MSTNSVGTNASIPVVTRSHRAQVQPARATPSRQTGAIYLIGGFLGSGKTTLVKRLVKGAVDAGDRPAVLMSEFADSNVEGALLACALAEDAVEVRSLFTHCACCDHNRLAAAEVDSLLRAGRGPIFVETDGCTPLLETTAALAGIARTASRGNLVSVISVLDARRWRDRDWQGHDPRGDVRVADTIVLSRLEAFSSAETEVVAAAVGRLNPDARIFTTTLADFPATALAEAQRPDIGSRRISMKGDGPSQIASGLESVTAQILGPVNVERLAATLSKRARVLRVKGVVRTTEAWGLYELQWVPGGRLDLRPAKRTPGVTAHLTVVGQNVDWERFADDLDECVLSASAPSRRSA
jgi:G3E family GTPase